MHADFFRSGPDLLIIGENGEQVLVRGYFTLANPPALVSEGGLSLSGKIVGHLAGPVAPGQYAQTGDGGLTDPIGQITTLTGVVEIVRVDGVRETVTEGGSVYQGDVVITGEDGAIEIEFADQSMFSLGGDGRMVLDEMIYDPAEQKGSMGLGVVSGTFSFISGQIAKTSPDAMTLETPVATIGIRGTTIAGSVGGEGTENSISLLADADGHVGEAVISNAAGTVVISQAGATVTMTSLNQAPPPPVIRSPEEIANTYGNVVTNLPSPPAEDNEPTPTEDDLFPQEVQQLNEMMQDLSEAIKKRVEQQYRHAQQEMEAHKVIQHLLREPHITEEFIGNIRQEIVAQVNPGLSLAVSAFSDTVSTITVASSVAAAAEEASTNVQTVASAAEELSSSISEINRQVNQSNQIASNAATEAERSNEQVQGLAVAAQKIGEVVELISDIAEQTNLLALNATIEAARAGDAGKGFAVVASEVKNLANQTAKATEEIGTQIGGIQTATKDAVDAIQGITSTIGEINEISTAIAAAVEEQGSATQEIARNVEQASAGTSEVTTNITQVTTAAGETGQAAGEVLSAAGELSQQGEVLGNEMDNFVVELRKVI